MCLRRRLLYARIVLILTEQVQIPVVDTLPALRYVINVQHAPKTPSILNAAT